MVLKTVGRYGRLDCAFNAATVSGAYPIIDTTIKQWDGMHGNQSTRRLVIYEISNPSHDEE